MFNIRTVRLLEASCCLSHLVCQLTLINIFILALINYLTIKIYSNMTSIKRHTRYYSTTLCLAQVQCTTNLAVPCDSRCAITVTTKCKREQNTGI